MWTWWGVLRCRGIASGGRKRERQRCARRALCRNCPHHNCHAPCSKQEKQYAPAVGCAHSTYSVVRIVVGILVIVFRGWNPDDSACVQIGRGELRVHATVRCLFLRSMMCSCNTRIRRAREDILIGVFAIHVPRTTGVSVPQLVTNVLKTRGSMVFPIV